MTFQFLGFANSVATVGNPCAGKYANMARKSASRGSKNFVFSVYGDDLQPMPAHKARRAYKDNPFKETFGWIRFRWCWHDLRMFGLWETIKKQYYMGEGWRRRDERIFCGKDENGNNYWQSRKAGGKQNGRIMEPHDKHWFRGHDMYHMPSSYAYWLQGQKVFTPNQEAARGEKGATAHVQHAKAWTISWNEKYMPHNHGYNAIFDPWIAHQPGLLYAPDFNTIKEAGYAGWTSQTGRPIHYPFFGEHDVDHDTVMAYYRKQPWHLKSSHTTDGDEWRVS